MSLIDFVYNLHLRIRKSFWTTLMLIFRPFVLVCKHLSHPINLTFNHTISNTPIKYIERRNTETFHINKTHKYALIHIANFRNPQKILRRKNMLRNSSQRFRIRNSHYLDVIIITIVCKVRTNALSLTLRRFVAATFLLRANFCL